MKPFGILLIAAGGLFLFFGAVVGFETGFGHLRVMNLPMVIMGGVGLLSGVILYAASSMIAGKFDLTNSAMPPSEASIIYDSNKWIALVKYDNEIALIAEKLKPLGQKWVDEFASSYLALNDKKYLPSLIHKIIADAKKEDELSTLKAEQNAANDLAQKERYRIEVEHGAAKSRKKWFTQDIASLCGAVMVLLTAGGFFWFSGSEKVLKSEESAISSDSQPNDQRQYELQASDLLSKLHSIQVRLRHIDDVVDQKMTHIQRDEQRISLNAQSKLLIEHAPKITNISGWSCLLGEAAREKGWVIARCKSGQVSYQLQFGISQQQLSYNKLNSVSKGAAIVFSGEVKINNFIFSDVYNFNFVEVLASLDVSR